MSVSIKETPGTQESAHKGASVDYPNIEKIEGFKAGPTGMNKITLLVLTKVPEITKHASPEHPAKLCAGNLVLTVTTGSSSNSYTLTPNDADYLAELLTRSARRSRQLLKAKEAEAQDEYDKWALQNPQGGKQGEDL